MAASCLQGFALASSLPYTDPITKRSILSEGANHGNGHDFSLR